MATRDPVEHLKAVYALHKDTLSAPGMRIFAPGDLTVKSHDAIADFLLSEGFAVCVLNGKKKCIHIPGSEEPLYIADYVLEDEIMEVGIVIARMYRDQKLSRFPFAITGKICLGRGITFNCEQFMTYLAMGEDGTVVPQRELVLDFLFDAAIVPPMNNRATLYQCASRVNGNIRGFKNYTQPTLYMTSETHQTILDAEAIAMNLPVLVHTHKLLDIGKEEMEWAIHGDEERYRESLEGRSEAVRGDDFEAHTPQEFKTFEEARAECRKHNYTPQMPKKDADGFYMCSTGSTKKHSYAEVIRFCNAGKRTSGMECKKLEVGQTRARMYACYKDDGELVFIVRTLTRRH
jgi:hypothetical protein